jgi:hypothetical protein
MRRKWRHTEKISCPVNTGIFLHTPPVILVRVPYFLTLQSSELFSHPYPFLSVLRILDVYPGFEFFPSRIPDRIFSILDPNSFRPESRSRIRVKEFKYFYPKKSFLCTRKYDLACSSRIQILSFYPSRIPDPGVKKAPDPESATLSVFTLIYFLNKYKLPKISPLSASCQQIFLSLTEVRLSKYPTARIDTYLKLNDFLTLGIEVIFT